MTVAKQEICLVGHPYAPIGMGEHVRCSFRALRSVALRPRLVDIYGLAAPETDDLIEFSSFFQDKLGKINIFHINGDEVEQSLNHISAPDLSDGYNIIYPAWELAEYPGTWARQLDRFDEIWAPSQFIEKALKKACSKPVVHMPLACEVFLSSFLGRRYFGIPESDYVFLFFYDLRSYATRKNPQGIIKAFERLVKARPYAKTTLVIKVNGGDLHPAELDYLKEQLAHLGDHAILINRVMTDNEVKNLVRCGDCFVSLHRSEGYGRGIAEAMALGKPVIATAYSGNMDFMAPELSFHVPHKLVQVMEGEYPHGTGQVWAEPDIDEASAFMKQLVDSPENGRKIGKRAARHISQNFGYRSIGLRYRKQLESIMQQH